MEDMYKTVWWHTQKNIFCHLLYPPLIDWFISSYLNGWDCAHVWSLLSLAFLSGYQRTLIYLVCTDMPGINTDKTTGSVSFLALSQFGNIVLLQHKRIYGIVALHHHTPLCVWHYNGHLIEIYVKIKFIVICAPFLQPSVKLFTKF